MTTCSAVNRPQSLSYASELCVKATHTLLAQNGNYNTRADLVQDLQHNRTPDRLHDALDRMNKTYTETINNVRFTDCKKLTECIGTIDKINKPVLTGHVDDIVYLYDALRDKLMLIAKVLLDFKAFVANKQSNVNLTFDYDAYVPYVPYIGGGAAAKWISTKRTAIVKGTKKKTVYRNSKTGELRVRKMVVRPDGTKRASYVKLTA
jgi:hypothetical protein